MALTRAMLKGMGLTEEQVSAIVEEHTSVTSSLKEQLKTANDSIAEMADLKNDLAEADKELKKYKDGDWENKYNTEHEAYEKYKSEIADKETSAKLKSAYTKLLKDCKVGEKHIDSILRVTDFKDMKLNDDGTFDNADDLKTQINEAWAGFVTEEGTKGADVETPPEGKGGANQYSRAAELAAKYHKNLYGETKKEV